MTSGHVIVFLSSCFTYSCFLISGLWLSDERVRERASAPKCTREVSVIPMYRGGSPIFRNTPGKSFCWRMLPRQEPRISTGCHNCGYVYIWSVEDSRPAACLDFDWELCLPFSDTVAVVRVHVMVTFSMLGGPLNDFTATS